MPASTLEAIFAAQLALAPSQIIPETMASALTRGVGDRFQVCALQIGNAAARSTARADGPAVGGQPPYTGLFVDRNQVGEGQCAAESLIGCPSSLAYSMTGTETVMP